MPVSTFTYSDRAPVSSIYSHVNQLNGIHKEVLVDLAAISFSEDQSYSHSEELISALAMKNDVNTETLSQIAGSLKSLLRSFTSKGLTVEEISEDLQKLGMEQEKASLLAQLCSQLGPAGADGETESLFSSSRMKKLQQLVDLEWKFGVTAASSELDRVGSTFLQLKLVVKNSDGQLENLHMELSLTQFYTFLHELEKAKASLDSM